MRYGILLETMYGKPCNYWVTNRTGRVEANAPSYLELELKTYQSRNPNGEYIISLLPEEK